MPTLNRRPLAHGSRAHPGRRCADCAGRRRDVDLGRALTAASRSRRATCPTSFCVPRTTRKCASTTISSRQDRHDQLHLLDVCRRYVPAHHGEPRAGAAPARKRVGRDIFMYSITLNPRHDTPRVLKRYAGAYNVGPGWQFLTGPPDDIEFLRRKLRFTDVDPEIDKDPSRHSGNVRYGNEPLMQWAMCRGKRRPGTSPTRSSGSCPSPRSMLYQAPSVSEREAEVIDEIDAIRKS